MQTVGVNEFQGLNVPLITIEQFLENGTGAVECDNIQGGCLAAEHLIAQGCRHLIHISGVHETAMPADERAAGFCEVCVQKNVQYQVVGTHAYEYNHLEYHEVLEQLLLQHPDTDGIFASSDLIAAQLLQVCAKLGRKVPEQLKIVGFDDVNIASLTTPPITTYISRQRDGGDRGGTACARRGGTGGPEPYHTPGVSGSQRNDRKEDGGGR